MPWLAYYLNYSLYAYPIGEYKLYNTYLFYLKRIVFFFFNNSHKPFFGAFRRRSFFYFTWRFFQHSLCDRIKETRITACLILIHFIILEAKKFKYNIVLNLRAKYYLSEFVQCRINYLFLNRFEIIMSEQWKIISLCFL